MPAYRFLLCDLLTDQPLAQLPLTGVTFERRISRRGSLSATLSAPTPHLVDLAKLAYDYAGRSALWVYRDQALWWGGIPWTVTPSQGERGPVEVSVQAATFDSYAHHRQLDADLTYTQTDQGVIIPDLWRRLQADPRGNIGMVAEDQPTGVLRDRTYLVSEAAPVGALIENLGDVNDGPEHTVDTYLDGDGNRVKRLRVASRIGSATPRIVFQRSPRTGGRVLHWSRVADAVDGGTRFRTRGDTPTGDIGQAQQPLLSKLTEATDLLDAGWPLLDVVEDRPGVTETATLDGYAYALASENAGAIRTAGYEVSVGATGWNPNRIGEAVRVKLQDAWHDTGADLTVRPVGCRVQVSEKGQDERVTLLMGGDD